MRFRPEQHLRRAREIRDVRESGRRIDARAFTLWWKHRAAESPGSGGPRVCVIASTAAVGGAIRRNRAKRRLREVFRECQQAVPPTCDLLLIARTAVLQCPMPELLQLFNDVCRRIPAARPAPPEAAP